MEVKRLVGGKVVRRKGAAVEEAPRAVKAPVTVPAKRGRRKAILPAYDGPKFDATGEQAKEVSIDLLNVDDDRFQVRAATQPEALVESIRSHGILDPLVARPHPKRKGQYQLISGFNRAAAAKMAGLSKVPVIVKDLGDQDAIVFAFAENQNRQSLGDLDRANAIRKLKDSGAAKSTADVAKLLRLGERQVRNLEALLKYPDELKDAVADGASGVTATHALVIHQSASLRPKETRTRWMRRWIGEVRQRKLSVAELKKEMRSERSRAGRQQFIRERGALTIINLARCEGVSRELKDDVIERLQEMIARLKT